MIQLRIQHVFFLLLLLVVLTSCATAPRAESVEDGIAVGYLTIENLAEATGTAYQNKWIDTAEKNRIADSLQEAHDVLQDAQALVALGQPVDAQDALGYAESILLRLQAILQEASP